MTDNERGRWVLATEERVIWPRRTICMGLLSMIGGWCVSAGTHHHWWRLVVIGLLCWCFALAIVITGHTIARRVRQNIRAAWYASIAWRILRRFR